MWPFTKKVEKDARANYEFTKQDRDYSAELRRKTQELKLKEQQMEHEIRMKELQMQLEELDYELNGEEEQSGSNPDMMLMTLFSQILNKQSVQANSISTPETIKKPEQIVLSDEQMLNMWSNVPKQYKLMAKAMSDEQLIQFLHKQLGNIDTDTTHRALAIIRG